MSVAFWLAPIAAAAGLVALLWRTRAETARLRRRLDAASGELQRLQTAFGRFAPEAVVERIAASGLHATAERKEVTVLFADLVGFTPMSEGMAPEILVGMLNAYFARMSGIINAHRGHVAKFIGDGLMALFGALEPNPWQTNDAVHAALAMRGALETYNRELQAKGQPTLRVGIGIHRGPVVAGIIGSREWMEFTAIGHTVNLAARVERLTRVHEIDIAVTTAIRDALDPNVVLRPLPPTTVPGVADPVHAFAVERIVAMHSVR